MTKFEGQHLACEKKNYKKTAKKLNEQGEKDTNILREVRDVAKVIKVKCKSRLCMSRCIVNNKLRSDEKFIET